LSRAAVKAAAVVFVAAAVAVMMEVGAVMMDVAAHGVAVLSAARMALVTLFSGKRD
jgi:hypothetical protein